MICYYKHVYSISFSPVFHFLSSHSINGGDETRAALQETGLRELLLTVSHNTDNRDGLEMMGSCQTNYTRKPPWATQLMLPLQLFVLFFPACLC